MKKFLYVAALLAAGAFLMGYGSYGDLIPNGGVYSCQTCHGSGYSLNSFGEDFLAAGSHWSYALSQTDSDGGGASNGAELLDPDGEWSGGDPDPGDPSDVTNPGDPGDDGGGIAETSWGVIRFLFD